MSGLEDRTGGAARWGIAPYLLLSLAAGTTAGMLRALSPIFALRLGAEPAQIGIISGAESLGMAAMTLPAGVMISRFGARRVYVLASLTITLVYLVVPLSRAWLPLALGLAVGGCCMPFRIVSISSSFLDRLRLLGRDKAGWYGGSTTIGMLLLGPSLATALLETSGLTAGYWTVSALFGAMGGVGLMVLSPHRADGETLPTLTRSVAQTLDLLRDRVVAAICTIELSQGLVFAFFSAFIVVAAVRLFGLSEPEAILIRLLEGAVAVFTSFFGGYLVKDRPVRWIYRVSLVLIAAGFLLLGTTASHAFLLLSTLLLGCGFGLTSLINVMRLSETEAPKGRLSSLQLFSSMSGAFCGALLGGFLSAQLGLRGMFLCGGGLYALLASRWCFGPSIKGTAA